MNKARNGSRFRRIFFILFLFLSSGIFLLVCYNISNRIAFYRGINCVAEWKESNGQSYLYIEADTYYDLGYLTGCELANKIFLMKEFLLSSASSMGTSYYELVNEANKYLDYIPDKYKEEIKGLSEGATFGSGFLINTEDILIQTLFFELLYGRLDINADGFGCTDLGAKNKDNSTIIGQNMDLIKPMGMAGSFVHHKLKGEYEVFSYRIGGSLALPMGKNEKGVTIVMNLVQIREKASIMTPTAILIREGLAEEDNVADFYDCLFPKDKSPYGLNYLLADDNILLAVQATPDDQYISFPNTTIVHSNTYLRNDWEQYLSDPDYSLKRQEYAEDLIEEEYEEDGYISNKDLLNILSDRPIICRDEGTINMATVAFMTKNSFGLGTSNDFIGKIPI